MKNSERWQNLPEIKMLDAASASDNTIRLQGKVSHSSSNCEYFFLCSLDGKTFSKSEIKAEYKNNKYTGVYIPSAEGTYYFKFCAVSIGRYSYIESEAKAVEYKEIVPPVVSEAVDLGLSVKWATCNVGATKPEEYGGYYQWAGTEDVTSTSIYLDWDNCPYHTGRFFNGGWTKYNSTSPYGTVDNKRVLEPSDDAAHVNWGGSWRMPTDSEWTELRNNCTWTWTTQNGVKGYKVTSKKTGYTSSSIFLPTAGYRDNDYLRYAGSYGYYWSSSRGTGNSYHAYDVYFNSSGVYWSDVERYLGYSIRPVSE